jgi:energy-coupling factor transporter ATP-binding protein EcfA2
MKLKIRKFDPSTIKRDAVVLLIGKRGSGKSTLMRDIMYHMRDKVDFGLAMSPTEDSTEALSAYIPRTCIYNDFSGAALDVMLEIQRLSIKRGRYKNVYMLMDDCMSDRKIFTGKNIREVFLNGRHKKMFYMNAVQYMMDMPPQLRNNVDYVFALKENIISSRVKLHQCFFGVFGAFPDFDKVMNSCTQGYDCIVLDNRQRSSNPEDCVFWYAADTDLPDFRVGADVFWDLDRRYYRDREAEEASHFGRALPGVADRERQQTNEEKVMVIEKQDVYGEAISTAEHPTGRRR